MLKVKAAADAESRLEQEMAVANPIAIEGKGGLKLRVPKEVADELAELRAFKARSAAQPPMLPATALPPPRAGFAPTSSV